MFQQGGLPFADRSPRLAQHPLAPQVRGTSPDVAILRTPDDGLQPQVAVDRAGQVHVVYFKGPGSARRSVLHACSTQRPAVSPVLSVSTRTLVRPLPQARFAVPTSRSGSQGRVHVAWMGSSLADAARDRRCDADAVRADGRRRRGLRTGTQHPAVRDGSRRRRIPCGRRHGSRLRGLACRRFLQSG